jgi:hypothetical protein
VTRRFIPQVIVDLAHARREARGRGEWDRADELRREIEEAGWVVVDSGVDFELRPAHPADVVDGGIVRYGSSSSVPSRLDEPPSAAVTFVVVLGPGDEEEAVDLHRLAGASDAQVVVVVNGSAPNSARVPGLEAVGVEIIQTAPPFSPGAARNAGLRRASGAIVAVLEPHVVPAGAAIAPDAGALRAIISALVDTLADPDVAIAGTVGLGSGDLRHFAPTTDPGVTAVTGPAVAFRRSDYVARGPLDERFRSALGLDIWWSLVLRDAGDETRPRRAVRFDLGPAFGTYSGDQDVNRGEGSRPDKRDAYRILDRFGGRQDLANP